MPTHDCLIGYSGFVGQTLLRQRDFPARFRSTNIAQIDGGTFGTVVCSAAPAQKWIANREPQADRENVDKLIQHVGRMTCERFVLISTVDVFGDPVAVDEGTAVEESGLHPYGLHRRALEKFVERKWPERHLIIRLPGLVGPGLRKNVLFDLLNDNNLASIDTRATFQFYPMVNLWWDIQTALAAGLDLLHLTAEPIRVGELLDPFRKSPDGHHSGEPAAYDFRTRHAKLYGGQGEYQYSRRESLQAIRAYAQSEPFLGRDAVLGAP